MHAVKQKADRKGKVTGEQSWAQAMKAEGIGMSRDDEQCRVSGKVHPADQHFAGGPGGYSARVYPVSAKPKQKPKCARP